MRSFDGAFLRSVATAQFQTERGDEFPVHSQGYQKPVPDWSPQVETACPIGVSKGVDFMDVSASVPCYGC